MSRSMHLKQTGSMTAEMAGLVDLIRVVDIILTAKSPCDVWNAIDETTRLAVDSECSTLQD